MPIHRIPGIASPGLTQSPAPDGGAVAPGGAAPRPGGPQGLAARPLLTRSQSMPPRLRLPARPLPRPQGHPAAVSDASHEPAGLPLNTFFAVDPPSLTPSAPPAPSGGGRPCKPETVHVEAAADTPPPAAGAAPSQPLPVLNEMQQLQETQRQGMQQQAEMQRQNLEMQIFTARMKLEMDLVSAQIALLTKGGEAVKHAAGA